MESRWKGSPVSMLLKVTEIRALAPHRLRVRFSNGAAGVHDCAHLIADGGPMVEPMRDQKYFARVFLELGAPTWPNGFDICPDWLHMEMKAKGELLPAAAE